MDRLCCSYFDSYGEAFDAARDIDRKNLFAILPVKDNRLFSKKIGYQVLYYRDIPDDYYNKKVICEISGGDCLDQIKIGKYDSCIDCEIYRSHKEKNEPH